MKSITQLLKVFFYFIIVSLPLNVAADTDISKNITTDTTWSLKGSPYIISGEIQVFENVTLTIKKGVEVKFNQNAELQIGGELKAIGGSEIGELIKFTSNASTPPKQWDWFGIVFLNTSSGAVYEPGFKYDYDNHYISLDYASGSIMEWCIIEYANTGIASNGVYPCIKNSFIRYCSDAIVFKFYDYDFYPYDEEYPDDEKWLLLYGNTIEGCGTGLSLGTESNDHAIISNNTFKDNKWAGIYWNLWQSVMMIFNNQFINNEQNAIQISDSASHYSSPLVYLDHNRITDNGRGVECAGDNLVAVALHNDITNNRLYSDVYYNMGGNDGYGAGLYMEVFKAYLFNNTIQMNGVEPGEYGEAHGDGIYLQTSDFNWNELNKFVIRFNNLGNSVWDKFDIYIGPDKENCSLSKELEVDATNNYWMASNPADTIYDASDDTCAGTVSFKPVANSPLIFSPMSAHPELVSPENNIEVEEPGFGGGKNEIINMNLSWTAVPMATKYLVITYGHTYLRECANNVVEVIGNSNTSVDVPIFSEGWDKVILHWFVVPGNDSGWGLPSEVSQIKVVDPSGDEDEEDNNEDGENDDNDDGGGGGGGCFIKTMK